MQKIIKKQISARETEIILQYLNQTLSLDGDVVELGCYTGDTSIEIARLLKGTDHKLWLYDSFEGLPSKSEADKSALGEVFAVGELGTSKSALLRRFRKMNLPIPIIKKAWFSDLIAKDLPEKISFAFLDGDYHDSIRDSLKLIENQMTDGGVIIVHDYQNDFLPGVRRAVDEWLIKHPHKIRIEQTLAVIQL